MEPPPADAPAPTHARQRILVCASTLRRAEGSAFVPSLHELCEALVRDADVTVLVPGNGGERPLERLGAVEVERFPFGWAQRGPRGETDGTATDDIRLLGLSRWQALAFVQAQARAVRQIVADRRIDAVHSHGVLLQGLGTALARGRRASFRHVLTLHGGESWGGIPMRGALARYVIARTDRVFAVSSDVRDAFDAVLGAASGASLRPMGIDTARYRSGPVAESPFAEGFLLVVSPLGPKDGVDDVLRALTRVRDQGVDVGLIVVGDGPEATPLIGRVHELRLDDAVQFVGQRPARAVTALLRASRALVVPPRVEPGGTPGPILPALAAGARVVAGPDGWARDWIEPGCNGWRTDSTKPDALAALLLEALATPRPDPIDDRARETAAAHDWRCVARAYHDASRSSAG